MTSPDCKEIPGFPGYYCDKLGNVYSDYLRGPGRRRNALRRYPLKPGKQSCNYLQVRLKRSDNSYVSLYVHRLMLLTYVGPCPEGMEVRHLDGSRNNNNLTNLLYGSHSENMYDAVRHGTCDMPKGEKHPTSKLKNSDVLEIRKSRLSGKYLSVKYDVCPATISMIRNLKIWTHI